MAAVRKSFPSTAASKENARLKHLVADLTLDKQILRVNQVLADCRAMREGVGPDGNFAIDLHQRFNFSDALRCCRMIEETHPFLVENPVATDLFQQDIPRLRTLTSVPLAAGEEWGARYDFVKLVTNRDLDYIRVSLPNTGGITEMVRIASMCETHEVGIVPHFTGPISTAAQVHTLGTFPIPVVMEFNYTNSNIAYLDEFVTFQQGKVYPNDRPGFGINVHFDQLQLVDPSRRRIIDRYTSGPTARRSRGRGKAKPTAGAGADGSLHDDDRGQGPVDVPSIYRPCGFSVDQPPATRRRQTPEKKGLKRGAALRKGQDFSSAVCPARLHSSAQTGHDVRWHSPPADVGFPCATVVTIRFLNLGQLSVRGGQRTSIKPSCRRKETRCAGHSWWDCPARSGRMPKPCPVPAYMCSSA